MRRVHTGAELGARAQRCALLPHLPVPGVTQLMFIACQVLAPPLGVCPGLGEAGGHRCRGLEGRNGGSLHLRESGKVSQGNDVKKEARRVRVCEAVGDRESRLSGKEWRYGQGRWRHKQETSAGEGHIEP